MARIGIQNFMGMLPIKDPALVPDTAATYASNAYLYNGTVQGFRTASSVFALTNPGLTQQVYRIPNTDDVKPDFINSLWLEFTDPFISVLRSPQVEDQFKRYYFFPSTGTPYYNTLQNIRSPGVGGSPPGVANGGLILGVPAPTLPMVESSITGGTAATQEVRSYVYTWVTAYGEESAPSPAVTAQGPADASWAFTVPPPPFSVTNNRNITKLRVYRTITDTSGNAAFTNINIGPEDFGIGVGFVIDGSLSTALSGNAIIPSLFNDPITGALTSWDAPPADLQGVVQMANGIMAGWSNEVELWFSVPYLPHAWPAAYSLTVDAPIVGLAAVGTSLVVCTEGSPWMATGVSPNAMTLGVIKARDPCISRGSICAAGEGVYYASPNGLIVVNSTGTVNVTTEFMSKENWIKTNPYDFAAARYNQAYMAAVRNGDTSADNGMISDRETPNTIFSFLHFSDKVANVYNDELSGSAFVVTQTEVIEWNPSDAQSYEPYVWQSKEFRFPFAQQFIAGCVLFDVPDSLTIPPPTTHNTDQNQTFDPSSQYLLIYIYADKRLVLVREILQSGEVFKIPSGFKARYWSAKLVGQVTVRDFEIATSTKELQLV
jgi:hypothetical protein